MTRRVTVKMNEMASMIVQGRDDGVHVEDFAAPIFQVASAIRIDFICKEPLHRIINAVVAFIFFLLGLYTLGYTVKTTFDRRHTLIEISTQLLIITWAIQSLISMVFLVYWQLYGHLSAFRRRLAACQQLRGVEQGRRKMQNNVRFFFAVIAAEIVVCSAFLVKFYMEESHTEFASMMSYMFYFPHLRPVYTVVTIYMYMVWNIALFVLILYTNATFLEVRYYNQELEKFDGSTDESECEESLLSHLQTYGQLIGVIRDLDTIFRLYAFIMIVTTIPSMIFTLMMMNQRINSLMDLLISMPSIALCVYSFFAVTIAPARLHDEISRTKSCFCQNKSIWFPYRREVYLIANTFASHMEQYELGVSVWGFAVLSRPLILATLSATAMMLSLLTELGPKMDIVHGSHKRSLETALNGP